jgi:hypothetical protein
MIRWWNENWQGKRSYSANASVTLVTMYSQSVLQTRARHILRGNLTAERFCVSLLEFPTDSRYFENETSNCLMTDY